MKPISNPRINQKVLTKTGYKIWIGSFWRYYHTKIVNCSNCNKKIVRGLHYNKNNRYFCSRKCQCWYHFKQNDQLGSKILDNKNLAFYYLIGLICTDGHVDKQTYVSIGLQKKDKEILDQIYKIFGGHLREFKHYWQWSVGNRHFRDYLFSIGLTQNKTYTLDIDNLFNKLTIKNKWAFLRGCWDGDGSISYRMTKHHMSCYTNLGSASRSFINTLKRFIQEQNFTFNLIENTTKNGVPYYSIWLANKHILPFLDKLYDNNNICLQRKYLKFQEISLYYKKGN